MKRLNQFFNHNSHGTARDIINRVLVLNYGQSTKWRVNHIEKYNQVVVNIANLIETIFDYAAYQKLPKKEKYQFKAELAAIMLDFANSQLNKYCEEEYDCVNIFATTGIQVAQRSSDTNSWSSSDDIYHWWVVEFPDVFHSLDLITELEQKLVAEISNNSVLNKVAQQRAKIDSGKARINSTSLSQNNSNEASALPLAKLLAGETIYQRNSASLFKEKDQPNVIDYLTPDNSASKSKLIGPNRIKPNDILSDVIHRKQNKPHNPYNGNTSTLFSNANTPSLAAPSDYYGNTTPSYSLSHGK